MCDLRTFNRIESIVETKMAAGQMFTAFDITLALQQKRMRRLHREIRRDIKRVADSLMWRFGYERTLIGFEEVRASAFVYHPYGTDASLHPPSIHPFTQEAIEKLRGLLRVSQETYPPQQELQQSRSAFWRNKDHDQPVTVIGDVDEHDGRRYKKIEGSDTAIPEDELTFQN